MVITSSYCPKEKCTRRTTQKETLRHLILAEGIQLLPEKLESIK